MSALKISVSGIRGRVGIDLRPDNALKFALAFGNLIERGTVIVARDTRRSGDGLVKIIAGGLMSVGLDVVDLGIVPTPTALYAIRKHAYDGGIIVTASHNPTPDNGLKLAGYGGKYLDANAVERIQLAVENDTFALEDALGYGNYRSYSNSIDDHLAAVYAEVDMKNISAANIRAGFDFINGTGALAVKPFLEKLGMTMQAVHQQINIPFAHEPEPIASNLKDLSELVKREKCDVGFAQDPDADRLALTDETGAILGEEVTLALLVNYLLTKDKSNVTVNLSTSRMIDDICRSHQVELYHSAVGEANVLELALKKNCRIGGEGNGGLLYPKINYGRDSMIAIAFILEMLALRKKTMSQLVAELPKYVMKKFKVDLENRPLSHIYESIAAEFSNHKINREDGLRVDMESAWFHLRPSNTEPIVRLFLEGKPDFDLDGLHRRVEALIRAVPQVNAHNLTSLPGR